MEADFLRDYRIDLREELCTMSWRRFLVLCRNLSPSGAVAARIRAIEDGREQGSPEDGEDPGLRRREADRFFTSIITV